MDRSPKHVIAPSCEWLRRLGSGSRATGPWLLGTWLGGTDQSSHLAFLSGMNQESGAVAIRLTAGCGLPAVRSAASGGQACPFGLAAQVGLALLGQGGGDGRVELHGALLQRAVG